MKDAEAEYDNSMAVQDSQMESGQPMMEKADYYLPTSIRNRSPCSFVFTQTLYIGYFQYANPKTRTMSD